MMMVLTVILILLFTLIIGILFIPVRVEIDSIRGICRATLPGAISFRVCLVDNEPAGELKVFFWRKILRFSGSKIYPQAKTTGAGRQPRRKNFPARKVLAAVQTFRVKFFQLRLDTDDMALNGKLYPLFYAFARMVRKDLRVNFAGENFIRIKIQNNLARALWAFMRN